MTDDSKPLVDELLDPDERRIFESARGDRPTSAGRRRAAMALGLGPLVGLGVTSWTTKALGGKAGLLGWGGVLGGVSVLAVAVHAASTPAEERTSPAVATSRVIETPLARPLETPVEAPRGEPVPSTVVVSKPLLPDSSPVGDASSRSKPKAAKGSASLADQIERLDRVRALVASRRGEAALAELAAYRARHGGGAFAQEAAVLGMQALEVAGRAEEAHREARAFLAKYPRSPHAARVSRF